MWVGRGLCEESGEGGGLSHMARCTTHFPVGMTTTTTTILERGDSQRSWSVEVGAPGRPATLAKKVFARKSSTAKSCEPHADGTFFRSRR